MKSFSRTIEIDAPPARVWTVMSDVERWHEWTASISSVRRLDAGPLTIGSRAHVRQPKLRPADFIVTDLDEHAGFSWVSHSPGIMATGRHLMEPTARGTRVTLAVEFDGLLSGVVAWLFGDLTQRYLALEAEGLKARSEHGEHV